MSEPFSDFHAFSLPERLPKLPELPDGHVKMVSLHFSNGKLKRHDFPCTVLHCGAQRPQRADARRTKSSEICAGIGAGQTPPSCPEAGIRPGGEPGKTRRSSQPGRQGAFAPFRQGRARRPSRRRAGPLGRRKTSGGGKR
jgi:hypothetical protein